MKPERELHERIKMRLRLAGSSLSCVARELGVKATTVTSVSSERSDEGDEEEED